MKRFLIYICLLCAQIVVAQTETQLALEYFRAGAYEKALPYLEQLYTENGMSNHLDMLIKCYKEVNNLKGAEKFLIRQIKKNKTNLSLLVELGTLYETMKEPEKAEKTYNEAIEKLEPNEHLVTQLGKAFADKQKFKYEEKCYLQGRKIVKSDYTFSFELAETYLRLHEYDKMLSEYIRLIETNDSYVPSVKGRLQSLLYYDADKSISDLIRTQLIEKIQKYPNNEMYSDLYVWLLIQEKEFGLALFQAKAIDKRTKDNGSKVYELGLLALENNDYNIAADAFQYIIDKGDSNVLYNSAKKKFIESKSKFVFSNPKIDISDLTTLESQYLSIITQMGKNAESIEIIRDLAKLQIFYLNKAPQAIEMLAALTTDSRIPQKEQYLTMMVLAEAYLFVDDIWESNLLYAKIEKENSNNPIGFDAKLMRAKISYYSGEFKWAESLLDILKASTSKLIANDAFELAHLINDNIALDTTTQAMQFYAHADLLFYQKKDSLALKTLDSISILFPKHSLADEIEFKKAQIAQQQGDMQKSILHYETIVAQYEFDIYGDNALFYLAEIQEKHFNNIEKAQELYKKIITEHQDSIFVTEARKRYRALRGDDVN